MRREDVDAFAGWAQHRDPLFRHYNLPALTAADADELWAMLSGSPAARRPYVGLADERIVAITACPTGIAHTFMAADALKKAALARGDEIHVETQGSVGANNALSPEDIAAAVLYLASDAARFVTGQVMRPNGGVAMV